MPGARHADEVRLLKELIGILPLRDLRQRIGTRDEVEIRIRVFARQVRQRIDRVGRPTAVNIDARHGETRIRCGSDNRHQVAMLGRGHASTRLEGLHRGRDEDDLVEAEDVHDLRGRNEVAVVDRIEGAAHDADRAAPTQRARGMLGRGRGCGRPRRGLSGLFDRGILRGRHRVVVLLAHGRIVPSPS